MVCCEAASERSAGGVLRGSGSWSANTSNELLVETARLVVLVLRVLLVLLVLDIQAHFGRTSTTTVGKGGAEVWRKNEGIITERCGKQNLCKKRVKKAVGGFAVKVP